MRKTRFRWRTAVIFVLAIVSSSILVTGQAQQASTTNVSVVAAQDLIEKANTLNNEGKHAAAIPFAERAVAIRQEVLGFEHPETAAALNVLGYTLMRSADYPRAEQFLKRALALRERVLPAQHADIIRSLDNLGRLYTLRGKYSEAKSILERALANGENTFGPDHPDVAGPLSSLAGVYYSTAAYAQAEPLYKRSLAIREKAFGPNDPSVARTLNSLGNVYFLMTDFQRAESMYSRALAIKEKTLGAEHPEVATSVGNLANVYIVTAAYSQAESMFKRALAIEEKSRGPNHPDTATVLHNYAHLYDISGAYELAIPLYERALAIREKSLGSESADTAHTLSTLGTVYVTTDAYSKADPLLRRAIEIDTKNFGLDNPITAAALRNLAGLEAKIGHYEQSAALYDRALSTVEKTLGPDHLTTAEILLGMADLKWLMGEPHKSTPLMLRALIIETKNLTGLLLSNSEARRLANVRGFGHDVPRYVSMSIAHPGSESARLGLQSVLMYKGRELDATTDIIARLRQGGSDNDRQLIEQFAQLANQFSTLTYQDRGKRSANEYRNELSDLEARQETLGKELAKKNSSLRDQVTYITVASVRRAIPPDAALVEWLRYVPFDPKMTLAQSRRVHPRYVAYLVRSNADPVAVDLGEADIIDSLAHEFRVATSDPTHSDVKSKASSLGIKLLTPLLPHLHRIKHLLLSPDGGLNLVPMSALIDERGDYLAQRFEITYLSSGRDLLRFASRAHEPASAVVVADPDYGTRNQLTVQDVASQSKRSVDIDGSGLVFRPLSNTALEAEDLKKLLNLNPSNIFLRGDATETSVKQLHGPTILHIASHGFFLNDQAHPAESKGSGEKYFPDTVIENSLLRSGIALAGANARHSGSNEDGILTALEAAQLDLQGTELVVLSACDSGLGDVQNGEGVYGLRRALVLAGAQTQVTSLWKVPDEATRTLMVDFYQRLLKGEGRSAALRHAQQDMIANPELSHPYYWASFIPVGNWTPLRTLH